MTGCPTCGGWWRRHVQVRRGRARLVGPREEAGFRHSLRVYWPPAPWSSGGHLACPDPYHVRRYASDGAGPEPYAGVNRHDPDVSRRRAAKARRHKARQGKAHR